MESGGTMGEDKDANIGRIPDICGHERCENPKKGGDTMAAITNTNNAYIIRRDEKDSDKSADKSIPVMDRKTLESHIKAVEKYLKNK